jgi:hypothetical protein
MRNGLLLLAAGIVVMHPAVADIDAEQGRGSRGEIWLALPMWPALGDLQPVVGGSFKSLGYGLGGAVHWPWRPVGGGDLMLGFEGAIMATDSDIPVILDELLARDLYIAASVKWRLGRARKVSLDAGLAYHLLDIAQLETDYNAAGEFESWEEDAFGPFVGMTWDGGGSEESERGGMTLGLRIHFLDVGTVRDEDVLASVVLGRDAGRLDGPLVMLHVGYRW